MDRVELRRRLNTKNGVPVIDQRMLRGGLRNINLRREIARYSKEIDSFNKDKEILALEDDEDFNILMKVRSNNEKMKTIKEVIDEIINENKKLIKDMVETVKQIVIEESTD